MGPPSRWLLDGAAGGDDLLLGRAGDLIDRNDQLNRNVTIAENLDLLVVTNGTLGNQRSDGYIAAGRVQLGQAIQGMTPAMIFDVKNGSLDQNLSEAAIDRTAIPIGGPPDVSRRGGVLRTGVHCSFRDLSGILPGKAVLQKSQSS